MQALALKELLKEELGTIKRPSLAEEAAQKLKAMILLERLAPGTSINERELSERLGISRTPLREAIRQLEMDGLVEYSDTRRPRVADPSLETLSHWLMVQGALEGLAGELACELASDKELAGIATLQRLMIENADHPDPLFRFQLDMDFHIAIVSASQNLPLAETHNQYNARLWRARFISSQRKANRDVQARKHQGIVEALLARDGKRASMALREHLGNTLTNIKLAKEDEAEED